jgi:type III secretion system FlhB-like substrate exporter
MPTQVPTQEEFAALVESLNELAGKIEIPEEVKPAIKAVLEWLCSKLNGSVTWS